MLSRNALNKLDWWADIVEIGIGIGIGMGIKIHSIAVGYLTMDISADQKPITGSRPGTDGCKFRKEPVAQPQPLQATGLYHHSRLYGHCVPRYNRTAR